MTFDPYQELCARIAVIDNESETVTLGDETPPDDEPLFLGNRHQLGFVERSYRESRRGDARRLDTAVFGLMGPVGPLPFVYSEMVARADRSNEPALKDFLAIFSRRAISLLYRAWRKNRMPLEYQPGAMKHRQRKFSRAIEGLTGSASMPARIAWLDIGDKRPLQAADLFLRPVRNSMGLRQFLRRQFGLPIEIEELVGNWEVLPQSARPTLGSGGLRPALGKNTVIGSRTWQVQSTFRLVILRPNRLQYQRLKPASESLRRIQLSTRMYCTGELAFRLRIVVSGKEIEPGALGDEKSPALLGWNTLAGPPDPDRDYVFSISRDYNEGRMPR